MTTRCGPVELTVGQIDRDNVFNDVVRVHLDHRRFAKAGKLIVVEHNGRSIRAVARGAPQQDKSRIWLDLRCREKLGLRPNAKGSFVFRKASWWDEFVWAWHASDAASRIAARIGLVSVGLGLLGAALGGLSLWLALAPATP